MIAFIIVLYRQNQKHLNRLLNYLKPHPVICIDNNINNLGYAAGVNLGIKKALQTKTDWIIVLNQDITLNFYTIKLLNHSLANHSPAIVGPFAGELDKKRWTTIYPYKHKLDYISGSFLCLHRKVVEKTGYFYEPYFMYYEDVDYCLRAKKNQLPIIQLKLPCVKHTDNSTLGKNSFLHQYYLARNHLLLAAKLAPISIKLYEIIRLPKTLWEHFQKKETGALRGIFDFFLKSIKRQSRIADTVTVQAE